MALLRVVSNTTYRDNTSAERGLWALRSVIPAAWIASFTPGTQRKRRPAAKIRAPGGKAVSVPIYAERRITPKEAVALGASNDIERPGLVTADYLSPGTRERLRGAGLGYIDLAGNAYLVLQEPGLAIDIRGADSDPNRIKRPARSLKGIRAGQVVRILCEGSAPMGVRSLAKAAGVDAGYVSRLLSLLDQQALIERKERGGVTRVDRRRLLRKWADDAPLSTRGRHGMYLEPRGLPALIAKLKTTRVPYAVSGSLAAARIAPIAAPRLAVVYVDGLEMAAEKLGLRPADAGANVMLIDPIDRSLLEPAEKSDGVNFVNAIQAAADLLGSSGRAVEEGEALITKLDAGNRPDER